MASYAISSSLILVIHDNMIIGTNLIILAIEFQMGRARLAARGTTLKSTTLARP
jgi:hypothetical protein